MMINRTSPRRAALLGLFVAALVWTATPATADPSVLSFSYTTLAGSFTASGPDSGSFVAEATSNLNSTGLFTFGTVTRLVDPVGFAGFWFDPFFISSPGLADFVLSMNVTSIDHIANTAVGAGTLKATDVDGDVITADVSGGWKLISGQATFTGATSNIVFSNPSGVFNGQFGTSFSTDFSQYQQLLGVTTDVTGVSGGLFATNFADHSSLVTSQLIPVPGAVLLGIVGLGTVAWIRRRLG